MEKKSIGAFIAVLRKVSGLTQKDLADKLGVSDKTVSHWERDESAPDLMLIPVIAEIFGVTCDELLRGERIKNAPLEKEPSVKMEKQIKYLLSKSREKFMTRSMVALGLAVLGLLAAMILNFAANRAYLGFFIGCIFWTSAIICESVFYSHAASAAGSGEFSMAELSGYRIYAIRLTEKIISASAIMFAAALPLVFVNDAYFGLAAGSWLALGLPFAAVAAVICFFTVYAVNRSLLKKGVYALVGSADIMRHKHSRLQARCAAVVIAVLFVIFLGQQFFNSTVTPEALSAGITFNNCDDFKAYMETEKENGAYTGDTAAQRVPGDMEIYKSSNLNDLANVSGGEEEYYDQNGNAITKEQALANYLYDDAGNVVCEFIWLNGEVATYSYSGAGTDKFAVTVCTYENLMSGEASKSMINARISFLYFLTAGVGILVYFIKRAKLNRSL